MLPELIHSAHCPWLLDPIYQHCDFRCGASRFGRKTFQNSVVRTSLCLSEVVKRAARLTLGHHPQPKHAADLTSTLLSSRNAISSTCNPSNTPSFDQTRVLSTLQLLHKGRIPSFSLSFLVANGLSLLSMVAGRRGAYVPVLPSLSRAGLGSVLFAMLSVQLPSSNRWMIIEHHKAIVGRPYKCIRGPLGAPVKAPKSLPAPDDRRVPLGTHDTSVFTCV